MRTGLTKREKTTAIFFDEYGSMIEVQTHNTDLIKRLSAFAAKYPECCRQIDDDEQGGLTFEIEKGRLSFRLTAPYSEERRRQVNGRRRTESKVEKLSACLPEKALYTMNIYNLMLIEVIQTAIIIMG